MNVEAPQAANNVVNTAQINSTEKVDTKSTNKDGNSFKDEMLIQAKPEQAEVKDAEKDINATKNADAKATKNNKTSAEANIPVNIKNAAEAKETTNPILPKDIEANIKNQFKENDIVEKDLFDSICDLNEKIKDLSELKALKTDSINQYLDINLSEKSDMCKTISMDKADTTFFLNLVENQTMTTHNLSNQEVNNQIQQIQEIKAEATQKTVSVSKALIECLNESMKTNKPFRIDFDNNIAVIMKVDKDGVLSANFIPGSTAVENYLRNNIGYLRQAFDEENLSYNELTYTKQDSKKQKNNNRNNQQENKES